MIGGVLAELPKNIYNRGVRHRPIYIALVALLVGAMVTFAHAPLARAADQLSYVSDTINDSRLSLPANHVIVFRATSGIPASGKIVISFENNAFPIDPSFSETDMNLAVSASSPFSGFDERTLASTADNANDGVFIKPFSGPITITLSSGAGITAGSYVRILLGTNAPAGAYQISNPSVTASYHISLNTYTAGGALIDYGAAMVAILPGIGVDANTNGTVPVLSNGLPSGTIPSNVTGVLVSFNTNLYATCRYSMVPDIAYKSMTIDTTDNSLHTFHTFTVTGITKGDTYTYYARCSDFAGMVNPDDYIISFTAGDPTGTGAGGGTGGGAAASPSGGGGGGGGGGAPYPTSPNTPSLVISGVAMPNVAIAVLQDGAPISASASTDGRGNFSVSIPSLPQGTYSFTVEATNGGSTPLSVYTTTITLISGTTNNITGIVLPPSIGFVTSTVALGKPFLLSGLSVPSSTVDIWVINPTSAKEPLEGTAVADSNGVWSYPLSTKGLSMGTYQIKARASVRSFATSNYSSLSFLGVGEAPTANLKIGDLNGDGKVNLVDFSILLAHWGTNYVLADLNGNGKVDLPDLSIMLSHWTG